eukprot:CAMPEP_0198143360 /NCGR_PEP_ID=MMETSP1443-20131203/6748_1 /TAXON_ID=186043 /ORGANISM="Entomoneis sp., Strain CCMP2396" /LENGTH=201 /DNA_ID=CAMNT_0043806585 /DNA_START=76 /DNA_END=681 /DNA_ORIENTATION=+
MSQEDKPKVDEPEMRPRKTNYFLAGKENLQYEKEDCPTRMIIGAIGGTIVGTLFGLAQSAWYPPEQIERYAKATADGLNRMNATPMAPLKRPVVYCTAVMATYKGAECLAEYVRDTGRETPWWNSAAGGAASGLLLGAMLKRFDVAATACLTLGLTTLGFKLGDAYRTDRRSANPSIFKDDFTASVTEKTLKKQYPELKDM